MKCVCLATKQKKSDFVRVGTEVKFWWIGCVKIFKAKKKGVWNDTFPLDFTRASEPKAVQISSEWKMMSSIFCPCWNTHSTSETDNSRKNKRKGTLIAWQMNMTDLSDMWSRVWVSAAAADAETDLSLICLRIRWTHTDPGPDVFPLSASTFKTTATPNPLFLSAKTVFHCRPPPPPLNSLGTENCNTLKIVSSVVGSVQSQPCPVAIT